MLKLSSCIVASADQDKLEELRDVSEGATYSQQIKNFVLDGRVSFINISTQQLPSLIYDAMIIEDQWVAASRILRHVSQCEGINNVIIVSSSIAAERILEMGLLEPAVITLDFLLEGSTEDPDEKKLEHFSATGKIYRRIKEVWPLSRVLGISAWVLANGNPNSLTAPLVSLIRSNGDNVYPKGDALWSFLDLLVLDALSIYKIRAEQQSLYRQTEELSRKLDVSTKLRNYELSRYTQQHLAGIDDVLLAVAKAINPYFLWHRGVHESFPPSLRQFFVTSLLFEGEPGAGKTVLCEAIARAFESEDTILPKDLGPDIHPRGWRRRLDQIVTNFYSRARDRRVVVIRADDLVWPKTAEMEAGMASEWERYMRAVRDYIAEAARINSRQHTHFEGKVLWLFSRNMAEDVGEMFGPLENYLQRFRIEFPRDPEERKKVLVMHASNYGWHFDPGALNLAVEALRNYSGRDLVGDPHSRKGFLTFAINEAQEREQKLFEEHQDESQIRYEITVDIVNEWLSGKEHQSILESTGFLKQGPGELGLSREFGNKGTSWAGKDMNDFSPDNLSNSERLRLKADMEIMDQIERGLAAGRSLEKIGKEVFSAEKNATRAVQTYLETNRPAKVLHAISENIARNKWPMLIAMIGGRKAIHKNHPSKYPEYAKRLS